MILQPLHQIALQERVEHNAGRFLDFRQHPVELLLRPDQWIDVFHRLDLDVLRGRRAGNRRQRLAGGIGHQVQVEIAAAAMGHDGGNLWTPGEQATPARLVQARRDRRPIFCPHRCHLGRNLTAAWRSMVICG
jgi:hypothetical protein